MTNNDKQPENKLTQRERAMFIFGVMFGFGLALLIELGRMS